MKVKDYIRTDTLEIKLYGPTHPLETDFRGVERLLTAIEKHSGPLMPDEVSLGSGRTHAYSIDKVRRLLFKKSANDDVDLLLSQSDGLSTEYIFAFIGVDIPVRFRLRMIIPFAYFQEEGQQAQRAQDFIALLKAISEACDVVYGYAHNKADFSLGTDPHQEDSFAEKRAYEAYWLNVYGPPMVEDIGRQRVLSTPAVSLEELSNGAVLWLTRPAPTDYATEAARDAQARALSHLRDDLGYDEVLARLRERSAVLAPVERDWDPDMEDLLELTLDDEFYAHRQLATARLNDYRPPEVSEWRPIDQLRPADVEEVDETIENKFGLFAEQLAALLHKDVPEVMDGNPASLPPMDYHFWHYDYPQDFPRRDIDESLVPAIGAYLGDIMVRYLDGRWVPRRDIDESQVVVGDRAWLPFLRARHYMESKQAVLDYSLTKFFRTVQHYRGEAKSEGALGQR